MTSTESITADWSRADLASSILASDRAFVADSSAVRALIVERALEPEGSDDLLDAWAMLGELAAQRGCSPTLVSGTLDHFVGALSVGGPGWIPAARAALFEGFVRSRVEDTQRQARAAWEFPRCSVPIADGTIAIAAGYPSDDAEALEAWAGRVAQGAALRGALRVIVAGQSAPRRAVSEALAVVGIQVADAGATG